MRVLIVEDDIVIRSLLKVRINKQFVNTVEFEIESAESMKTAMECLTVFQPDVVILDLGLEDSGIQESATSLKAIVPLAAVIVVSNGLTPELTELCYKNGAYDVMDKFTMSISSLKDKIAAAHYHRIFSTK